MNRSGFLRRTIGAMVAGFVAKDIKPTEPVAPPAIKDFNAVAVRTYKRIALDGFELSETHRQHMRVHRDMLKQMRRDMERQMYGK